MRTLSANARSAIFDRSSPAVGLYLLTLTDPDGGQEFRVVNNNEDITSRGTLFHAYYFDFTLAEDSLEATPEVRISIDNTDRMLVDFLRRVRKPPQMLVEFVVSTAPDVVEFDLPDLIMRNVSITAQAITATLVVDDIWNQKWPNHGETYDTRQFPALA